MEGEKRNIVYVIVALVVVALLGWWLMSGGGGVSRGTSSSEAPPPPPEVRPELKLTSEEKSGDVSAKKAEIMAIVSSGKSLTPEQRSEITLIMLTKANIYQFSEEERVKISKALSRP